MCLFCGKELANEGKFHFCSCGYIETDDMSYEEIFDMFSAIEDDDSEEIPF